MMRTRHPRLTRQARLPRRNASFVIGVVVVGFLILTACVSLFYTPYDPIKMSIKDRLQGPSLSHLLGTDQYGRDILSRIMQGTQNSFLVGVVAVGIGMVFGVLFGLWAAFSSGWIDEAVMRAMDVIYAFPSILNAILFVVILGPGIVNAMIAIGIHNIPIFARLTRGSVLRAREEEYVLAAYSLGRRRWTIAWRHILPNILPSLIVQGTIQFAVAILAEAALSYLGLGTQLPYPSWGRMLREAQTFMSLAPGLAVFPGLVIALSVLGFNLLGDGMRDLLDPRLKGAY
ncbi:MAG: ABC transporter permease [Candidatus Bipolaricaulota bacterium]|nr:ABC transporter permease [Candidatus Bipolaricaulota bacterium]